MKALKKYIVPFVTVGLLGSVLMNFSGCSKDMSPVGPEQQSETNFTQQQVPNGQLKILDFQTDNKTIGKLKKASQTFSARNGGALKLAIGDDIRQIDYINQQPPIRSSKLARQLKKVSPLSAAVLIAAIDRQEPIQASHLYYVLRKNSPLNSQVLSIVLEKKEMFNRTQLYRLLYASLPLPQDIWDQIGQLGLTRKQIKRLYQKQDKVQTTDEEVERNPGNPCANVTFDLAPGAINEDLEISICMDDEKLSGDIVIEFGPHGIVFNEPAILNIEIYGLKFDDDDDFELEDLGLYYINQKTGQWEKMKFKEIIVNKKKGTIKIINAELPHFSRYAVGSE